MTPSNIEGTTALSPSESRGVKRLPNHTLSEILVPLSGALDLAERRQPGHACKVAYIAISLAAEMGLSPAERVAACYAGLFHDVGVITSTSGLSQYTRGDERNAFSGMPILSPDEAAVSVSDTPSVVVDRIEAHTIHGGQAAQELGLPHESVVAISAHHENWDGEGYPYGLAGEEIPVLGRVLRTADQIEAMIGRVNPLLARRNLSVWLSNLIGEVSDPAAVRAFRSLSESDSFWLGLFGDDLAQTLQKECSQLKENRMSRLLPMLETFSSLFDSRMRFTSGISQRIAGISEDIGKALGFSEHHLRQLRVAALMHDVGQLSVSERVMSKPAILSVEEWDHLRLHPVQSEEILAGINGLEDVALWVGAHHERPDGKGYPDGLTGHQIPVESRILAIADAYVALTSDRPHRVAIKSGEAIERLRASSGQLDPDLLKVLIDKAV